MRFLRKLMPVVCVLVMSAGIADAKRVQPEMMFGLPLADTSVSCDVSNLEGSVQCAGPFEGNDSNSILDDVFGSGEWDEIVKVEGGESAEGLTVSGLGSRSGTWSYTGSLGDYSQVMVALKGGNTFSLYDLELGVTSGAWNTLGIVDNKDNNPALSHFTLYGREGMPPSTIPLPAGGVLLLAALGALYVRRNPLG